MSEIWRRRGVALILGVVGGALFYGLDVPLAWLLGALSACLGATLLGVRLAGPGVAAPLSRVVLGVAIGGAFTPALMARMGEMATSLAFVPFFVLIIGLFGYHYFRRVAGFDHATAFFSAMPGGFQDMLAMGEDRGADVRTLALIHATRVIALVFLLPFLVEGLGGADIAGGAARSPSHWPPVRDAIVLVLAGGLGWWGATRLGLSGAAVVGPMVLSAAAHLSGLTDAKTPMVLINVAQLAIGIHIGCKYQGATLREIGRALAISMGFMVGLLALAAAFTGAVLAIIDVDPKAVLLAYSPGGQAEMNLIALVLDIDVAYVALHHLLRMVLVILGAQLIFGLLARRSAGRP